jgi:hypothetical protein
MLVLELPSRRGLQTCVYFSLLQNRSWTQRGCRHQLIVEGEPEVSGAVAQRDPHQPVPFAPGTTHPAFEHAGHPAAENQAVGDHPPAVPCRQRECQVKVNPHRTGTHRLTTGDAFAAVGTDPPERHACSLLDSW